MSKIFSWFKAANPWIGAKAHKNASIYYVAPKANWIIDWIGHFLSTELARQFDQRVVVVSSPEKLLGQVVHYGELWSWLGYAGKPINRRNSVVATIFHGNRDDESSDFGNALDTLIERQGEISRLITASTIMAERFIKWGIPPDRISMIPLGIDLGVFRRPTREQRLAKRTELGVPEDAYCIGSFHKDGVGWEEGMEPKLIKGPDIFIEAVERLSRNYKLHILLSGPARGFVKKGLDRIGVSYSHRVFDNYFDVAPYFHALDAYLIASREEGGPSGVLEAMASGIPLVTTRVGLAPDVARAGQDALICSIEDVDALVTNLAIVREEVEGTRQMVDSAFIRVQDYTWAKIAARYYHDVYRPILFDLQ